MQNAPIKRRTFLQNIFTLALLLSAAGSSILSGCSGNGNNTDPNTALDNIGNCAADGTEIDIQVVHIPNHTLLISKDDINAGVQKTYILENNGSGHIHEITLTAADFSTLRTNSALRTVSTVNAGHSHIVAVGCA